MDVHRQGSSTRVDLQVEGLRPSHAYGAHLHQLACGSDPAAAGPHYQNVPDPVTPSTDPRYANPRNEVWLDFTTDGDGDGSARSIVPFVLRTGAEAPHSLVLHAGHTMTGPGMAGTAGPRLACVNLVDAGDQEPEE
jgi:Cu-Zn family superoxide dismutase